MSTVNVKNAVREKYGQAALDVRKAVSCCGSEPSCGCGDPITSNLYDASESSAVPAEAILASLGCGNPTSLAELKPGEIVLDLGSGVGLTSYCLHVGLPQLARPTDWT